MAQSNQPAGNQREVMPTCETTSDVQPEGITPTLAPAPHRNVTIQKVANGFIIKIGCQTFVAKTWEEASEGLKEYWNDPVAAEKKYCAV